jgi:hypothetical protein
MIDDIVRPQPRQPSSQGDHSILPPPVKHGTSTSVHPAKSQPVLSHENHNLLSTFMTPERVAARDNLLAKAGLAGTMGASGSGTASGGGSANGKPIPPMGSKKGKTVTLFGRWTVSKKRLIIIISVLLLLAGGAMAYALVRQDAPAPKAPAKKAEKPAPAPPPPILSGLTGNPVTEEQRNRPVIGVMVENSGDARPQSGLNEAGVVFEAIAEYGITRFLALFQEQDTANIGPVRSSRPYYLDWAMAFDAAYAHVGGSPDALARIKQIGVKDMDQFHNSGSYRRITTRYAPHNVYTNMPALRNLAVSKGYATSTYTPFERKAAQPFKAGDTRTAANGINLGISGPFYNVRYDFDAASNTYKRAMAGAPHMNAETNTQLSPNVVIALVMPYSLMADGYHSQYQTIGSGKMFVFQDGTVVSGTWSKGDPKTQFVFKDDAGKVIQLNPGQTWISVVADAGKVTFQ